MSGRQPKLAITVAERREVLRLGRAALFGSDLLEARRALASLPSDSKKTKALRQALKEMIGSLATLHSTATAISATPRSTTWNTEVKPPLRSVALSNSPSAEMFQTSSNLRFRFENADLSGRLMEIKRHGSEVTITLDAKHPGCEPLLAERHPVRVRSSAATLLMAWATMEIGTSNAARAAQLLEIREDWARCIKQIAMED